MANLCGCISFTNMCVATNSRSSFEQIFSRSAFWFRSLGNTMPGGQFLARVVYDDLFATCNLLEIMHVGFKPLFHNSLKP